MVFQAQLHASCLNLIYLSYIPYGLNNFNKFGGRRWGLGRRLRGNRTPIFRKKKESALKLVGSVCVCVTMRPFQFDLCIIGLVKL